MKKIFYCFIFLLSFTSVYADSASDDLAKKLNSVITFFSDFTQEVVNEDGQVLQRSSGEMQFNRPLLFYWHTNSSNPQTMWYRKNELIVYDLRLQQATVKKVYSKNDPNLLPLMLLTGNAADVLQHFSVTEDHGKYLLKPVAKDKNELLIGVILQLASDGSVKEIHYQTNLGQVTKIFFNHVHVNQVIDQKLFFQKLPLGTDIVSVE